VVRGSVFTTVDSIIDSGRKVYIAEASKATLPLKSLLEMRKTSKQIPIVESNGRKNLAVM
jgi:hypothetical protein